MGNGKEQEGLSTGKKALAGAAVGIAVPAAVTVAKKLMSNGDEDGGEQQQARRHSSHGRARAHGARAPAWGRVVRGAAAPRGRRAAPAARRG